MELIYFLIIGAIAGWLAAKLMGAGGFGLLGNMVIGILGSVFGGYLLDVVGIDMGGLIGRIITATLGAIVMLVVIRLVKQL